MAICRRTVSVDTEWTSRGLVRGCGREGGTGKTVITNVIGFVLRQQRDMAQDPLWRETGTGARQPAGQIIQQNCAILSYYAMNSSNYLPTFRENISVPSSRVKGWFLTLEDGTDMFLPFNMGPTACPERLVINHDYSLRDNPVSCTSRAESEHQEDVEQQDCGS